MDSLYPAIKHIHLTFIALSVLFFIVRFVLHIRQSPIMDKKFVKIAPHVIDTLLLLSGLTLCFIIKQYPFQDAWLTEKIGAVVAYIFLATIALKANRNTLFKVFAALGAIAWIVYAAKIAMFKQAVLMG
ncbi:SirB family protein [Shewanella colwelliana]|uniref:Invasion protein n=1 Tax=Shewanella colwelliana TaxID=23 RepID=A0A1E5ISV0_SHECO|nr:SirB2 family protein [Shewanella colwelliana]MDX1283073.1 SirB2 family protein [Shewanella colwelliana]OEG73616.1 invasion protein [Shewanella colwelliana]GIU18908.1 SirB family protein [Shewanella colwelliana]GIU43965.1 SirB family protein [Shewanella colwelliana]